jgi:ankyrin repeat protein
MKNLISKPKNFYKEIKEKFENDMYTKQVLSLNIEKLDEEYSKKNKKNTREYKEISTKKLQIDKNETLENYYNKNGELDFELFSNNSIQLEDFIAILYNICITNDYDSFLKIINFDLFDIDVRFKNYNYISLIHLVVKSNSLTIFEKLLEMGTFSILIKGKSIDEEDSLLRKPIHIASLMGYRDFLIYLIKNGSDINSKDVYGFCPIHFSIINFNEEIVNDLILFGADINMKKNDSSTVIHDLVKNGSIENIKSIFKSEIKNKLKFNSKDSNGNTPLLISVIHSKLDFLKIFLNDEKITVDVENENGMNIFHLACHHGFNF